MGIFNLFNKEQPAYTDFKPVMVDEIYLISVPDSWSQFKSDRFRMKSQNNKIQLSITNYGKNISDLKDSERAISTIDDLKNQFLPLFKKFINEGGFISNNDLEIGKDYIYQSFKVDKETQYYYYTSRIILKQKVVICLVLRQIGKLELRHTNLMKDIAKSIAHKVG